MKRLLVARLSIGLSLALLTVAAFSADADKKPNTGPWDVSALRRVPKATWGKTEGLVQEVYYEGEPFQGKPTRVFAYYGRPEGDGPFPAVVLVHGGGGKAFTKWAEHWAKRGYAALAMDLAGQGPSGRLADGGPDQSDTSKFRNFEMDDVKNMWTYHAVANVILGHSLLADRPEVDKKRVAVTGISWGGYLTCIVAGIDDQLQAAVPVYGCGFLHENSYWVEPNFAKMTTDQRDRWVENFDPSRYLGGAKCPILFVNGTNDFAYPLDSYQKSYSLVKTPVTLAIGIRRNHGHIWTFPEVDAFIDSHVRDGKPLAKVDLMKVNGDSVSTVVASPVPVVKAELAYTTDVGPWQKRNWLTAPAEIKGEVVIAKLPTQRPMVCYLSIIDERGLAVSTPHVELAK